MLCLLFSALSLKMCVSAGRGEGGGLPFLKGLFRNIVLIELGMAKLFPVCLSLGWAFVLNVPWKQNKTWV